MPRLGLLMKTGTIGKWLKKEGDRVEKGEPLFEVDAEKITKKIEAPESGVLRKILVLEKTSVPVLQKIAIIAEKDEVLPADLEVATQKITTVEIAKPVASVSSSETGETRQRLIVTPVARKIAEEHKLDITKIKGTGPGGRIVREDVLKTVEEAASTPLVPAESTQVKPMTYVRKMIAERMLESQLTTAHVTLNMTVDMTEATKLRQKLLGEIEKAVGVRISYNDMIAKAVTRSLKDHPMLNSSIDGDNIKTFVNIHLGIAVATDEGLMVPVIRNANNKSLVEFALATKDLIEKVKSKTLSVDEVSGSTFTVSNLGMFGVETFTPIINPPGVAILGIGRIVETPAVIDGQIVVRSMMPLSLTVDHRVIDGDVAAHFLQKVKKILEFPYLLLI
jgi:pyruvate dehydrogenase E2 component (dihydrolipoamide acetyltransferase)